MTDDAHDGERLKALLQIEVEKVKADLQTRLLVWQESANHQRSQWLEIQQNQRVSMKGALDFATLTIRSLILINGGATIGVMTFVGNLAIRSTEYSKEMLYSTSKGLLGFVIGLVLAIITSGFAYITQAMFTELPIEGGVNSKAARWGNKVRFAAVGLSVLSLAAFCLGSYLCFRGFKPA